MAERKANPERIKLPLAFAVVAVHDPAVGVTPVVEHPVQFVAETHVPHPAGHDVEQFAGVAMKYPVLQAVQNPELRPM